MRKQKLHGTKPAKGARAIQSNPGFGLVVGSWLVLEGKPLGKGELMKISSEKATTKQQLHDFEGLLVGLVGGCGVEAKEEEAKQKRSCLWRKSKKTKTQRTGRGNLVRMEGWGKKAARNKRPEVPKINGCRSVFADALKRKKEGRRLEWLGSRCGWLVEGENGLASCCVVGWLFGVGFGWGHLELHGSESPKQNNNNNTKSQSKQASKKKKENS